MKTCSICQRADRKEIEKAILDMNNASYCIEDIAEMFNITNIEDLKAHSMFHIEVVNEEETKDSLVKQIKLDEANAIAVATSEYLSTLKLMSRRINKLLAISSIDVEEHDKQVEIARSLTKPMVDMYLGLGNEIRQNTKALSEINQAINGKTDSVGQGLVALASAIRGSDQND